MTARAARLRFHANPGIQTETNMPNMEITFFRVLREAKVTDDMAQAAVESLEEHIAVKIKEANRSLEIRLNLLIAITTISGAIGGYIALFTK